MDLEAINNQAKIYFDNKEFQKALDCFKQVSNIPAKILPNVAKCLYYTNQADKALQLLLSLEKDENLWIDIALYYNAIGDHNKAFEIYRSLSQDNLKVKFNIGWHYLRNGEFKKGFENIQYGSLSRVWGHEYLYIEKGLLKKEDKWDGKYTPHLLLILEGGLGDEIIFLRWAKYLENLCKKLTIICSPSLLRLLTNSGYDVYPHIALPSINFTKYCPAMSLPAICGINHPTEYVSFPYIKSFAEPYIIKQMDMLANGKKKIGVRFYGNKEFEHDQFRSPPREALESLSRYGQLFSLQLEEKDSIIPNCNKLINDWQDTYSVFQGLDILVTSCTSTAHLAGAMGIKAIVLVPLVPYFVWASDKTKWYQDNITIIRQTKYNDWSEAMDELNLVINKI